MVAGRGRLAAAIVLATILGCGEREVVRPEVRHADLAAYVSDLPGEAPARRVVLIGIDGASWDYLLPLIDAGELPAIARLVREGSSGRLRSIECHFTPPAWTTMFTGVLPRRHGIYSFGSWDGEKRRFTKVTSNEVVAPTIWDVASRAQRRVSVVGVPATYPAHPVEGVLVSGIMTPKTRAAPLQLRRAPKRRRPADAELESFSPVLTGALEDEHNVMLFNFLDVRDDGEVGYDEVQLKVLRKGIGAPSRRTLGEYRFPVDRFSPWVAVQLPGEGRARDGWLKIKFRAPGPDGFDYLLTPNFLRLRVPFTHPPSLARQLSRRFGYYLPHEFLSGDVLPSLVEEAAAHARYFFAQPDWDLFLYVFGQSDNAHHLIGSGNAALPIYRRIDDFVGDVLLSAAPDTTVLIASDHGFGAFERSVDLNQYLASLGLLHWKPSGRIDHEKTLVFHNMWHLHFNRTLLTEEELRRRAIDVAAAEAPAAALARHLTQVARELRAPHGQRYPVELVQLPADAVGNAPDMAVQAPDGFWVEFWNVDRPSSEIVRPLTGNERWKHAQDGIFAAWGPGIRAGHDLGIANVQDVAPTLLDLLGLPVADDFDGKVLSLLETEVAGDRALHRVASFADLRREAVDAPDDPASFEETLRALGYIRD